MDIACVEGDAWNLGQAVQALSAQGHHVEGFAHAHALQQAVRERIFDLYVVGSHLPDFDSEQLVLWLRNTVGARIPVMVLIAPGEDAAMVRLLSVGADGCAASPVRELELAARVQALLRRVYPLHGRALRAVYGAYEFDWVNHRVSCAGVALSVSPREMALAHYLFVRAGWLVPRPVLEERLWGRRLEAGSRLLDKMISRVRLALGLDGGQGFRLVSVYGHGFKLVPMTGAQALVER